TVVAVSNQVTYTLTVQNNGPAVANNVALAELLPPGATFIGATNVVGACSFSNGVVICPMGSIVPSASLNVTIAVTFTNVGSVTNRAAVVADEFDPNESNNVSSVVVNVTPPLTNVDLAIVKSAEPATVSVNS